MSGPLAIGIDFGTTFSSVGAWMKDHVEIISNPLGNRVTPSVVAFAEEDRLVGEEALSQIHKNPSGTICSVKRFLGRSFDDPEIQQDIRNSSCTVVEKNGRPHFEIEVNGETRQLAPEAITAMILEKVKHAAEDFVGQPIKDIVLTAPAHFRDAQRQALIDAATVAKLNVVRIVNEPTAAALAYGIQGKYTAGDGEKNVVVYDLGGGTFDVTVLTLAGGVFEVKTTTGEGHLGGEDFDTKLVEHLAAEFKKKNKLDLTESKRSIRKLRTACERVKRTLSTNPQASVEIDSLHEGIDFYTSVTRAKFEDLCADLFKKTIDHLSKAIADANLQKSQIDEVVLVGGSTRIPKIQQLVSDFFEGKELCKSINPDEAIAYGATVQAAIISGAANQSQVAKDVVVLDILPLSLGIESSKGVMTTIIKRKSTIPTKRSIICSTFHHNQENVFIKVFEGERAKTKNNKALGHFELHIEPRPRGIPQIEVVFEVDASGILNVSAFDRQTNQTDGIQITRMKGRLTPQDIEEMVIAAESYKIEDDRFREKLEARRELLDLVSKISNSLRDLGDGPRKDIEALVEEVLKWAEENFEASKEEFQKKLQETEKLVVMKSMGVSAPQEEMGASSAPF